MKKLVSMILVLMLVLGMLPTAMAEESCAHAQTTQSVQANKDGVHQNVSVCDACGETVTAEYVATEEVITVDFNEFAAEASKQLFWAALPVVESASGAKATRLGGYLNQSMNADQKAAYSALDAWMEENLNWSFDTTEMSLTSINGNRIYLSADDGFNWGLMHNTYYHASMGKNVHTVFAMDVIVPEAGWYDLSVMVERNTTGAPSAVPADTALYGYPGAVDVYVNDELVCDDFSFKGTGITEDSLAAVYLEEGSNGITFYADKNYQNDGVATPAYAFNLLKMDLTKLENCGEPEAEISYNGDKTHSITMACPDCGAIKQAENNPETIVMDFNAMATAAAQQPFWAAFPIVQTSDERMATRLGAYVNQRMSDAEKAAYREMDAWMDETFGWSFDTTEMALDSINGNRVYLRADAGATWGLDHAPYYHGSMGKNVHTVLAFDVNVAEAGWYDLNMIVEKTTTTTATSYPIDTGMNGYPGYEDIYVNDELVYDDYYASGTTRDKDSVCTVWLNEGNNGITFYSEKNYCHTTVATPYGNFKLAAITLTKTDFQLIPGGEQTFDVSKYVKLDEATLSVSVEGDAVTASVEAGIVTIAAETYGEAVITVMNGETKISELNVTVSDSVTEKCTDLDGNGKCDICKAQIAECKHTAGDVTIEGNGKTHTYTTECTKCGTAMIAELSDKEVITVDFKAFAQAASQEDFWAAFPVVETSGGGTAIRLGAYVNKQMTVEERAAYAELVDWMEYELNWSFDTTEMKLDSINGNRVWLTADEDSAWGLTHNTYYHGQMGKNVHTVLALNVIAESEGWYDMSMLVDKAQNSATPSSYPLDEVMNGYAGYVDIYINDELVYDDYWFGGNVTVEDAIGAVYLNEGINGVTFYAEKNYCHSTVPTPYHTFKLASLTFAKLDTVVLTRGAEKTVDLTDYVAYDEEVTAATHTVEVSSEAVTAKIVDGALVLTAVSEGEATVTVIANATEEAESYVVTTVEVMVGTSVTQDCFDNDGDAICDVCEAEIACAHRHTKLVYTANGDETHTVATTCKCGEVIATETEACADQTGDKKCDLCGGEASCSHASKATVYEANEDGTHQKMVGCNLCGEFVQNTTEDCYDNDEDGICDACDAEISTECAHADEDKDTYCDDCGEQIVVIEKITLVGANMTLGNDLKMNFMIKKSDMKDGYKAYVTQGDLEPVELELWSYNASYYAASYSVAAKEMTDVLSCEIYDADGYLVSNPFTRTVAQYAMTLLNNASQKASLKSVIVDMLNYGTEAQKYFHYNEDAYANAEVTDEQQAQFATGAVEVKNIQDKVLNCAGSNLSLEDSILLNVFFSGVSGKDISAMSATIDFVDYKGNAVSATVGAEKYGSSMAKVVINQVVLADAKRPVTVKLFDAEGNRIGEAIESVESYVARNLTNESTGAINMAIIKFATSAYNYLGGTN